MGDPAGIGPEIIMKALSHPEVHDLCQPLVIGDAARLRRAGDIVGAGSRSTPLPMQARQGSARAPSSAWT